MSTTGNLDTHERPRKKARRRREEEDEPRDDDLSLPPNHGEIDSAKLQSQISSMQQQIEQLLESKRNLESEKCNLESEKCNLESAKCNLESEKFMLKSEKSNLSKDYEDLKGEKAVLESTLNQLRAEEAKAWAACLLLDENTIPPQEELPTAVAIPSTEPSVAIMKERLEKYMKRSEAQISQLRTDITNMGNQIGEKGNQIGEKDNQIGEKDKRIAETNMSIGEKDLCIAKTNKFIAKKEKQLERATTKLQLLLEKAAKCEQLIESRIAMVGTEPKDPVSGLLYIQESHRITVHQDSDVNIGMLERTSGVSSFPQQTFRPKKSVEPLAISTQLKNAWALVNDAGLTKDQFIDALVKKLGGLEKSIVKSAWQSFQIEFPSNDIDLMRDLALQQFVYPPFAYLFKAAAGIGNEKYYKADEYLQSSLSVLHKLREDDREPKQKRIRIKPDAAVILHESGWDASGMMEIKAGAPSYDKDHRMDYDKCVLVTAVTALAMKRAMILKNDCKYHLVAIPFIIATGKVCSLYATTLDKKGHPCIREVQYPGGGNARNKRFESASCIERKEMFTALAVLLSRFKQLFNAYKQEFNSLVQERTGPVDCIPTLDLSNKGSRTSTHDRSDKTGNENTRGKGKSNQGDAQEAAACGGKFVNVACATMKTLGFNDISDENDEHTRSPFFFVGYQARLTGGSMTANKVFLKVWNEDDVKTCSVEAEWIHYKQAYDAGVPVASPALLEVARSTSSSGSQFLIIAVEYIHQDPIQNVEDLVQFCRSLVDAVEKLHKHAKILHCDLKPDNLRWRNGVVHLIDFEHAQAMSSARSLRSTEGFEAPEILNAKPCSTQTDAFSVGKTILGTLHKFHDRTIQQSPSYGILHDVAVNLTNPNPKARWNLMQALDKIQECMTQQGHQSISSINAEKNVSNQVTASPYRRQGKNAKPRNK